MRERLEAGVKGQTLRTIALALGRMGDLVAVPVLANTVRDESMRHGTRSAAGLSLGLICDPEEVPSFMRLWTDVNYPARTIALHEMLNYL